VWKAAVAAAAHIVQIVAAAPAAAVRQRVAAAAAFSTRSQATCCSATGSRRSTSTGPTGPTSNLNEPYCDTLLTSAWSAACGRSGDGWAPEQLPAWAARRSQVAGLPAACEWCNTGCPDGCAHAGRAGAGESSTQASRRWWCAAVEPWHSTLSHQQRPPLLPQQQAGQQQRRQPMATPGEVTHH
jgi:hypothetical protein